MSFLKKITAKQFYTLLGAMVIVAWLGFFASVRSAVHDYQTAHAIDEDTSKYQLSANADAAQDSDLAAHPDVFDSEYQTYYLRTAASFEAIATIIEESDAASSELPATSDEPAATPSPEPSVAPTANEPAPTSTTAPVAPSEDTELSDIEPVATDPVPATEHAPLLDIPLDADVQWTTYTEVCGYDQVSFCLLMAVAKKESRYTYNLIGDQGRSFGMYQVQPYWHHSRMARFGAYSGEDLFDPIVCGHVALDYLRDIMNRQGTTMVTHGVLIEYNAGHTTPGVSTTPYSEVVMGYFNDYMAAFSLG